VLVRKLWAAPVAGWVEWYASPASFENLPKRARAANIHVISRYQSAIVRPRKTSKVANEGREILKRASDRFGAALGKRLHPWRATRESW